MSIEMFTELFINIDRPETVTMHAPFYFRTDMASNNIDESSHGKNEPLQGKQLTIVFKRAKLIIRCRKSQYTFPGNIKSEISRGTLQEKKKNK